MPRPPSVNHHNGLDNRRHERVPFFNLFVIQITSCEKIDNPDKPREFAVAKTSPLLP